METLRSVITWVGTSIFGAFLLLALTENIKELLKQGGANTLLVRSLDALPKQLQDIFHWECLRGLWWLWSIFGLGGGFALALWLTPLMVDPIQSNTEITRQVALQSELNTTKQDLEKTKQVLAAERQAKAGATSTTIVPPNDVLENLRKSDGVTLIDPIENHLPIQRIPNGRFGYVDRTDVQLYISNP